MKPSRAVTYLPDSMLAARYPTGGADAASIRVERVDRPVPGPGEVLVAVAVSGINPTDWKGRRAAASEPRGEASVSLSAAFPPSPSAGLSTRPAAVWRISPAENVASVTTTYRSPSACVRD
jgi:NADPH:quinone reductase and related Zn-dependent oxidoreductases